MDNDNDIMVNALTRIYINMLEDKIKKLIKIIKQQQELMNLKYTPDDEQKEEINKEFNIFMENNNISL